MAVWRPWLRFVGVQLVLAVITLMVALGLRSAGFGWVGSRVFVLATILAGVGAVFAFLFGVIWVVEWLSWRTAPVMVGFLLAWLVLVLPVPGIQTDGWTRVAMNAALGVGLAWALVRLSSWGASRLRQRPSGRRSA